MGAVAARTRMLLRTNVGASVAIAVIAGLAGGLVLATWSAARRGGSSFERFLDGTGQGNVSVFFCAPGVTAAEYAEDEGCKPYDPVAETGAIRKLPGVETVARVASVLGVFELNGESSPGGISTVVDRQSFETVDGRPIVVEGRRADPADANEIVIGEEAADLYRVKVGDVVGFTTYRLGMDDPEQGKPGGETSRLKVVGIVRTPQDIAARVDVSAREFSSSAPYAGPAWWERYGRHAEGFGFVLVRTADQHRGDLEAILGRRFRNQIVEVDEVSYPEHESVRDAIGYETTALNIVALACAVAWIVFVGQALLRQSAREDEDAHVLVALGMTRPQFVAAAGLRALPVAGGTALIAVLTGVVSSRRTPIGVAAQAELDPGLRIDAIVVVVGAAALVTAMLAGLAFAAMSRRPPRPASAMAARRWRLSRTRSAVAGAGLSLTISPYRHALPRRLAGLTTVVALACAVAGLGLVASLHHLIANQRGYGSPWDAVVVGDGDPYLTGEDVDRALPAIRTAPAVLAAEGMAFNNEARVNDLVVPMVAIWSLDGPRQPWPVITAGRAPRNQREVALGPKTMRALGVGVGDRARVRMSRDERPTPTTIVGEALVYDGFTIEPGEGAVVDASWFGNTSERKPDMIAMRSSSPHPDWRSIEEAGLNVLVTPPPPGVRNLNRIDEAPLVIAAIVGLLAFAALAHAMATVARSERHQLAVLRAIGFTRRQVAAALASVALAIVGVGVILGVPAGIAAQRWIWSALERQVGFASSWFTGWWPIVVIALALVLAPAVGAFPGWAASRRPTADVLRAE